MAEHQGIVFGTRRYNPIVQRSCDGPSGLDQRHYLRPIRRTWRKQSPNSTKVWVACHRTPRVLTCSSGCPSPVTAPAPAREAWHVARTSTSPLSSDTLARLAPAAPFAAHASSGAFPFLPPPPFPASERGRTEK